MSKLEEALQAHLKAGRDKPANLGAIRQAAKEDNADTLRRAVEILRVVNFIYSIVKDDMPLNLQTIELIQLQLKELMNGLNVGSGE